MAKDRIVIPNECEGSQSLPAVEMTEMVFSMLRYARCPMGEG